MDAMRRLNKGRSWDGFDRPQKMSAAEQSGIRFLTHSEAPRKPVGWDAPSEIGQIPAEVSHQSNLLRHRLAEPHPTQVCRTEARWSFLAPLQSGLALVNWRNFIGRFLAHVNDRGSCYVA